MRISEPAHVKPGGAHTRLLPGRKWMNESYWHLSALWESDPDHAASAGEAGEPHLSSERKLVLPHNPTRVYFSSEHRMRTSTIINSKTKITIWLILVPMLGKRSDAKVGVKQGVERKPQCEYSQTGSVALEPFFPPYCLSNQFLWL